MRLFHTVVPIPECCKSQMKLCGNLSLNVVEYQCCMCFKRCRVTATFEEDTRTLPMDAETMAATDATE